MDDEDNENQSPKKREEKKENANDDKKNKKKDTDKYKSIIQKFLLDKNLEPLNLFGEGTFGYVYEVKMPNNHKGAAKVMLITKKKGFLDNKRRIEAEIGFSLNIHDQNIIKSFFSYNNLNCEDVISERNNNTNKNLKPVIYVVLMEKAVHSSLNKILHYLNKTKLFIPTTYDYTNSEKFKWLHYNNECLIRFFMVQIISALECMYRNQFVHNDIKPENVLISSGFIVKLCDFSLTKRVNLYSTDDNIRNYQIKVEYGTLGYLGPEYYNKESFCQMHADGVDIFALGSILYNFLSGKRLIEKNDNLNSQNEEINDKFLDEKTDEIKSLERIYRPSDENGRVIDLVLKMLDKKIENRPGIYKILEDDWINSKSDDYKNIYNKTDIESAKIFIEFQKNGYCVKKIYKINKNICYYNSNIKKFYCRKNKKI